ncbi:unnamed protein product [Vitrella brassicaformis CCMP3155]|uniref:Dehydrogenase/reductase SDR family member 12 n=1 Tax=Vitrella brassicaformis (strain CCMP3155) TaxID=1169540 RepID=A0A0G4FJV4_VITBC|nr:unnamed protein product [Vitrella brassicaformis CCMP3155]|mmetsp:Transcript_52969/g.133346  ORF Transcript_52969/g.133346 Transcript_52969/m.133346 type:complete len:335 (-) Transcript_52969:936-1940(-)|eukprot:CEM13669.1 unnamed protein product [Vitrella brassicaformis CCMP3155]
MLAAWRLSQWYVYGRQSFTKAGFEHAAKSFNPADCDVDLSSRHFIITGATSGLGLSCAQVLARKGGTIHLVCRNKDKGEKTLDQLKADTNNQDIHLHVVDLSEIGAVRRFCSSFQLPLHGLINNAGIMVHTRTLTQDGHDVNFVTNVLSPFLMTVELLPNLRRSGDGRVIFVSSGGMYAQELKPDDLEDKKLTKYDGTWVYAHNKRAQVCLAELLAEKVSPAQDSPVTFYSMHPGWADTPGVRLSMPSFFDQHKGILRTAEQGADTIVWLAIAPSLTGPEQRSKYNGKFSLDRHVVSQHLFGAQTQPSDDDLAKLWEYVCKKANIPPDFYKNKT